MKNPQWSGYAEHLKAEAQHRTTAQLSSAERSIVNDRMIEQISALTTAVNELTRMQRETHPPGTAVVLLEYDINTDTWNVTDGAGNGALGRLFQGYRSRVEDIERFLASPISPTARLNDFVGRTRWQRLRWLWNGK